MLTSDTLEVLVNAGLAGENLIGVSRSLEQSETWAEVYSIFYEYGVDLGDIRDFFFSMCGEQREGHPIEKEWLALKKEVLERDAYECAYCFTGDGPWCADHVIPLSKGGTNSLKNLTACCLPCNNSKGNRILGEWNGRSTRL